MWLAQIKDLSLKFQSRTVLQHISFQLSKGRNYALVGPSGSGKTSLLRFLSGKLFQSSALETAPATKIILVEQQHSFKNLSHTSSFYYQQRFNSEGSEDAVTVSEYLQGELDLYEQGKENGAVKELLHLLDVDKLLEGRLIQLSNGEHKRVQLVKSLLLQPQVLLLDNAFVGLDQQAREKLTGLLKTVSEKGITVVLVTTHHLVPDFVTDVLELNTGGDLKISSKGEFLQAGFSLPPMMLDINLLQQLMSEGEDDLFEYAIRMKDIHVSYHGKKILERVNWNVRKGERWSLSGPNGAGKSTLLSLVNADNPQAYANEIYLFDKRRGTGESIWDIKKRIGYVSPELHLHFESSASVFETIASGLFDTIGLFRILNEEQRKKVIDWMKLLQIDPLKQQLLRNLPAGMQRLALLGRALIKNPPLLLLDEPMQGLDEEQAALFKSVIEEICAHSNKTLVYISHYKDEIPSCVNRFIRLEEGRVVDV